MAQNPTSMNQAGINSLGKTLNQKFDQYEKDRYPLEQQWLRNLRQYRGIYDPEVVIRPYGSTAYPKFTRKWVNGTVSRLMQMLFPDTEFNWDVQPSPIPELSTDDLQTLLNQVSEQVAAQRAQEAQAAVAEGKPAPEPRELSREEIEALIMKTAEAKCDRMRMRMRDQLAEMSYPTLAKKVVFSGVLYGTGLMTGPLVKKEKRRDWALDKVTGLYRVNEKDQLAPWFMYESIWDWYPDLSAKSLKSQDGYFMRRVMSREEVRRLSDRPDFFATRITWWLNKNSSGNYRERYWELDMRQDGDRKYTTSINTRKYEVKEWWGFVSGHDMKAAGIAINDDELANEFEANVWLIDDTVIKCIVNPMDKKRRPLNIFIYEEDDLSLAGNGLPQICRDSQLAICEAARMTLDNGSVVCTPSKLIKLGLLMPGHQLDSRPYMDWYQDPDAPDNGQDAVKNLSFDSHIPELQGIMMLFKSFGEEEVSLPPIANGDLSGGSEGARTQGNMSMLMGAASLPIRDTVRNFDQFTESAMGGLYDWNMEFGTDLREKGDYNIITRGSTSLVAKEVRAQNFGMLMQTLQPEEREFMDWQKNLKERMKTIDIKPEDCLASDEVVEQNREVRRQKEEALAEQQRQMIGAEIRATLADAYKSMALADKAKTAGQVQTYEAIMKGLESVEKNEAGAVERLRDSVMQLRDHVNYNREMDIKEMGIEAKKEVDLKKASQKPAAKKKAA